jgi:hypothetical protein
MHLEPGLRFIIHRCWLGERGEVWEYRCFGWGLLFSVAFLGQTLCRRSLAWVSSTSLRSRRGLFALLFFLWRFWGQYGCLLIHSRAFAWSLVSLGGLGLYWGAYLLACVPFAA